MDKFGFEVTSEATATMLSTGIQALPTIEPQMPETPLTDSTMSNYKKTNAYKSGFFPDVDEKKWYGFGSTKAVATVYEYGLMIGDDKNNFSPEGDITVAQAITMAVRVQSIYDTGKQFAETTSPWYKAYVDYAAWKGIIKPGDFKGSDYERPATRAEMAYIFSRSLPPSEFAAQNKVNSLPDVNSGTKYKDAIFMLYEAGILAGNDAAGTFGPSKNITRAEAAMIITRMILPSTRIGGKTYG